MKRKFRLLSAGVATVFGLACSVGFAAYVSDTFDGQGLGSPLVGKGWQPASGAVVTNSASHSPANSLSLPVLSGITNTAGSGNTGLVWTDFYTRPVLLSAAAPAVDTNATAQVYVTSNGMWATLSGNGGGVTVITNTWTSALVPGVVYPTVTVASAWHHVSVLHDYTATKWSLYVDDIPLATNLGFIANGASASAWFQVQNLGGDSSNVVWVDDFIVSNRMAAVLSDTNAVGTSNGVPPAVALTYFGVLGDPRPAYTNFGLATNIGNNAVSLQFIPKPSQRYVLVGGQAPLGSMTGISTVQVDAAGTSNVIADVNALAGGKSNYFYKVLTVSTVDGSVILTNSETYAWYKQDRSTLSRWYYSGTPVLYTSGGNTLGGSAGSQLAQGLHGDNSGNGPDQLVIGDNIFYLNSSGVWVDTLGMTNASDIVLSPGVGVAIKRQLGAASLGYSVLSGTWSNSVPAIPLAPGWNSVVWPFDRAATSSSCGFPNTANDKFAVLRAGSNPFVAKYSGGWKTLQNAALSASDWPQAGEGFMYYNASGTDKQWTPTR